MSKVTETANAIIAILGENDGHPVLSAAMYDGLMARVGTAKYLNEAAAHLRESGIMLVAEKHRQYSNWRIIDPATESTETVAKWHKRVGQEALTEMVREAQSLTLASHVPAFRKARNTAVTRAVQVGVELGYDPGEIIAMCEPVERNGAEVA